MLIEFHFTLNLRKGMNPSLFPSNYGWIIRQIGFNFRKATCLEGKFWIGTEKFTLIHNLISMEGLGNNIFV